jgi:D-sedoheptulose 7-phosphate isomerase
MSNSTIFLKKTTALFEEAKTTLSHFLSEQANIQQVELLSENIFQVIQKGGKIISCGNGGSMCDAMHFAEELTGKFKEDRKPLPALSISDPSHLSCVANDFGFDDVFSRYIEALGKPGDLLLAISTSGNSLNIIKALGSAEKKQMRSFCLLGKNGGEAAKLANDAIIVKSQSSSRIQEIHIKIIHIVIELLEMKLFEEK